MGRSSRKTVGYNAVREFGPSVVRSEPLLTPHPNLFAHGTVSTGSPWQELNQVKCGLNRSKRSGGAHLQLRLHKDLSVCLLPSAYRGITVDPLHHSS